MNGKNSNRKVKRGRVAIAGAAMALASIGLTGNVEAGNRHGNCNAENYVEGHWGFNWVGAKATCSYLNSVTKYRAHYHNWGRDATSSYSTSINIWKKSGTTPRSGRSDYDLGDR